MLCIIVTKAVYLHLNHHVLNVGHQKILICYGIPNHVPHSCSNVHTEEFSFKRFPPIFKYKPSRLMTWLSGRLGAFQQAFGPQGLLWSFEWLRTGLEYICRYLTSACPKSYLPFSSLLLFFLSPRGLECIKMQEIKKRGDGRERKEKYSSAKICY